MPMQQGMASASSARLEALKAKHQSLSKTIENEQSIPSINHQRLYALKKEKLKIKEEIEGIRQAS
jgi:hypothetical protein